MTLLAVTVAITPPVHTVYVHNPWSSSHIARFLLPSRRLAPATPSNLCTITSTQLKIMSRETQSARLPGDPGCVGCVDEAPVVLETKHEAAGSAVPVPVLVLVLVFVHTLSRPAE